MGRVGRSIVEIGITIVPLVVLWALMWAALDLGYWVPLLLAVVSYWLIGFTMACLLGFRTGLGAVGVWIGLSCGTAVYATLLMLRFRRLASRFGK